MLYRRSYILILILILSAVSLLSQDVRLIGEVTDSLPESNLLLEAQVLLDEKPASGIRVKMLYKQKIIRSVATEENGYFRMTVGFDSLVVIEFHKPGYIVKRIEVDTQNMPAEDKSVGYDAGLFKINMLKKEQNVSEDLYAKPLARFVYDPVALNFVLDRKYKKEVKNKFKAADQKPEIIRF